MPGGNTSLLVDPTARSSQSVATLGFILQKGLRSCYALLDSSTVSCTLLEGWVSLSEAPKPHLSIGRFSNFCRLHHLHSISEECASSFRSSFRSHCAAPSWQWPQLHHSLMQLESTRRRTANVSERHLLHRRHQHIINQSSALSWRKT